MKPIIITISGKAQHGKTTFANYLHQRLLDLGYTAKMIAFADGVKAVAKHYGWDGKKDNNGRVLLQFIGTQWGRKCQDKDLWVGTAEQKIKKCSEDFIIIDDCRFINEATYFKERGYKQINVRVVRRDSKGNTYDNRMTVEQKNHESEKEMDMFKNDYIFESHNKEYLSKFADYLADKLREVIFNENK
ncbi:hypothetical protein [Halocella sp. SP3-1]|uniref:hypothetical protein n=1 Tax=Halocella sp. SP3-1 TaxID=2382161 RepID=UPI000F75F712|nr:hypothetical protein [Halocella sp. SP3-1]AZO96155.1 hypothetical protein D7D81_17015 [Halocella sp. SP3-1]